MLIKIIFSVLLLYGLYRFIDWFITMIGKISREEYRDAAIKYTNYCQKSRINRIRKEKLEKLNDQNR